MTIAPIAAALVTPEFERYRAPQVGAEWTTLKVGAVFSGWCELTDDPDRPTVPSKPLPVGSRGRFARGLGSRGVALRFGVADDEPVLVVAVATASVHDVLLMPVRALADGRLLRRPAQMFAAEGWISPWVLPSATSEEEG